MQTNGLALRRPWAPVPLRLGVTAPKRPNLGQQPQGFLQSPVLALTLDTWLALSSAYLGWGFSKRGNNWSTFWYIVAAVSGFKALHDLGNIQRQNR